MIRPVGWGERLPSGREEILVPLRLNVDVSFQRNRPKVTTGLLTVVSAPVAADDRKNAARRINVAFVGYKCDLAWNAGLMGPSFSTADCTQGSC